MKKKTEYGLRDDKIKKDFPYGFIIFFLWTILCFGYATQLIALKTNYNEVLGSSLFLNLYLPWKVFEWQDLIAGTFLEKDIDNIYSFYLFTVAIFFISLLRKKPKGNRKLHGTAEWAKEKDLDEMGLGGNEGVYVGGMPVRTGFFKKETRYLMHNGAEHILAFAPTRSGKGVGLVIPTLLSWEHSSIILDIKGENYALTAGYRRDILGHTVLRFDPADSTHSFAKFNPLLEVRINESFAVSDAQNIAQMTCDPDGKGLKTYFDQAGYSLLTGLILHAVVVNEKPTMMDVIGYVSNIEKSNKIKDMLQEIIDEKHADILKKRFKGMKESLADELGRSITSYIGEAIVKADKELSGVVSTAVTNLSLYRDPTVNKNTSDSTFKIMDLMNHETPVDLYIVVTPNNIDRLRPLLRIFFNLALRKLVDEMKFENGQGKAIHKHRMLLMLDEFTSLGKLEIFQKSLAYMAGYGIKAYIIVQDLTQLTAEYTKEESIVSNCHIRIAYAPNKVETAKLLSEMTGKTTVVDKKTSISGKRIGSMSNASVSISEVARPLLTPDECMRLKGAIKDNQGKVIEAGDMLIFVAGHNAIYGKQILFFLDPVFMERVDNKAPETTKAKLERKEKKEQEK